jgi:1,5-anhydro-D-fructose reductase (1,5-anhydro-D-mannitol-forming)
MIGKPDTIQWGIIGCGDVCEVKSGPAFNKISHSKLAAVMRRDRDKAEDYARRHQVPVFYDDASQLIHDPNINAIYIATPPVYHEEYTLEALKAGKPVYVEKPVALNTASCERMIEAARQYAGKVCVAHYRRGLPLFNRVKELIHGATIGKVRLVRLTTLQPPASKIITQTADNWRVKPELSGGGLFHDLSPHQLDIIYWIFGEPITSRGHSMNQALLYQAPDMTTVEATYEGPVFLQGLWAFNIAMSATEDRCEIIGDKGMLRFSFFRKSTLEVITNTHTEIFEPDYPENIQQPMIQMVGDYFRGEREQNPCSLEDALVVMRMMDKTV